MPKFSVASRSVPENFLCETLLQLVGDPAQGMTVSSTLLWPRRLWKRRLVLGLTWLEIRFVLIVCAGDMQL